jgi:hypothetical protein
VDRDHIPSLDDFSDAAFITDSMSLSSIRSISSFFCLPWKAEEPHGKNKIVPSMEGKPIE